MEGAGLGSVVIRFCVTFLPPSPKQPNGDPAGSGTVLCHVWAEGQVATSWPCSPRDGDRERDGKGDRQACPWLLLPQPVLSSFVEDLGPQLRPNQASLCQSQVRGEGTPRLRWALGSSETAALSVAVKASLRKSIAFVGTESLGHPEPGHPRAECPLTLRLPPRAGPCRWPGRAI